MTDERQLPLTPSDAARSAIEAVADASVDVGRRSAAEWAPSFPPSPAVALSEGCCGCATSCRAKETARSGGLVFALGEIAYDLISEARRDSIHQHMEREKSDPLNPAADGGVLTKEPLGECFDPVGTYL